MAKRCPVSGKRKYRGKLDVMLRNCGRPVMAYAYRCRYCQSWHLTRRCP